MQIVQFFLDEDDEIDRKAKLFVLEDGLDLRQVASASGYYSYRVVKSELEYVALPDSIPPIDRAEEARQAEQEMIAPAVTLPNRLLDVRLYQSGASGKR